MSELELQNSIRVELSKLGHVVFRANSGSVRMDDGRFFKTGLPVGFPDLFGFNNRTGQIFFIEVKLPTGRLSNGQIKFAEFVNDKPVLYGVARSVSDAIEIVEDTNVRN